MLVLHVWQNSKIWNAWKIESNMFICLILNLSDLNNGWWLNFWLAMLYIFFFNLLNLRSLVLSLGMLGLFLNNCNLNNFWCFVFIILFILFLACNTLLKKALLDQLIFILFRPFSRVRDNLFNVKDGALVFLLKLWGLIEHIYCNICFLQRISFLISARSFT